MRIERDPDIARVGERCHKCGEIVTDLDARCPSSIPQGYDVEVDCSECGLHDTYRLPPGTSDLTLTCRACKRCTDGLHIIMRPIYPGNIGDN